MQRRQKIVKDKNIRLTCNKLILRPVLRLARQLEIIRRIGSSNICLLNENMA
jgi:hypothetical protein